MEHVLALLTGVCLWLLLRDFTRGSHRGVAQIGGELLLRVARADERVVVSLLVLWIGLGAYVGLCVYLYLSLGPLLIVAWVYLSLIEWALHPCSYVELRKRGMVLTLNRRMAFIAYRHVRYCRQEEPAGRLLVQLGAREERWSLLSEDVDAFIDLLAQHVEVRDASGKPTGPGKKAEPANPDDPSSNGRNQVGQGADGLVFTRFQFHLRTLLIAVLVVSASASWIGIRYRRSRQGERGAMAKMERFQPVFLWLNQQVVHLDFSGSASKPADKDLEPLVQLTGLRTLRLDGANLTDAGLKHLANLKQLKSLSLDGTRVTDAGLEHLRNLQQLESFSLEGTRITDAGLRHLRNLRQLRSLNLSRTRITDAGLVHLHGLIKLESVFLLHARVTNQGVAKLRRALPRVFVVYIPPMRGTIGGVGASKNAPAP